MAVPPNGDDDLQLDFKNMAHNYINNNNNNSNNNGMKNRQNTFNRTLEMNAHNNANPLAAAANGTHHKGCRKKKTKMMSNKVFCCSLALVALCLALCLSTSDAAPMPSQSNPYYNELEEVPDDILMELMARFGQTIMRARNDLENSKRTVDFGLARGYSGTQEAKHRMGLAAANFPGGPGRRRRSETEA